MAKVLEFKIAGLPQALTNEYIRITDTSRVELLSGNQLTTDAQGNASISMEGLADIGDPVLVYGDDYQTSGVNMRGFNYYGIVENVTLDGLHLFTGNSYGVLSGTDSVTTGFTLSMDVTVDSLVLSSNQWIYSDWGSSAGNYSFAILAKNSGDFQVVVSTNGNNAIFTNSELPITTERSIVHSHYDGAFISIMVNDSIRYSERSIFNGAATKIVGEKSAGDTAEAFEGVINSLTVNDNTFTPTTDETIFSGGNGGELELFGTTFSAGGVSPILPPTFADGYNIIVLAGQSNMVGFAPIVVGIDDDYTDAQGVKQLGFSGKLMDAVNPLDFQDNTGSGNMGNWLELVKAIKSTMTDKPILLLTTAVGSSGFQNNRWNAGDDKYNMTRALINSLVATTNSTVKGFFWHQGEADMLNGNDANYLTNLTDMWNAFQADCPAIDTNTPFICAEIINDTSLINSSLATFASSLNNGALVETGDLTDIGDGLHYDAPSLRTIGQRMGAAYLAL